MNSYVKKYILSVVNTISLLFFPLITFPYISRVLEPTYLGIINFVQSYGYYFLHIACFGINSYAIREVSRLRNKKQIVHKLCNEIFNLNLFFSIFAFILYFIGVILIQNFRDNFAVFFIYSIVILSNFLSLEWILQSYEDYLFSTIINVLVRIFSIIAIFFVINKSTDYVYYMWITCLTEISVKLSTLWYCRKKYVRLQIKIIFLNFRKHFVSLFTLFIYRLINGISAHLDRLMIGFMLVYSSVGIYTVGVKIILLLQGLIETVGIVLFAKINISATLSKEEYNTNLIINYNLILLIGIPSSLGLFLISERLIPLIAGNAYHEAISVSRLMSIIILLGAISDLLGSKVLLVWKKDKILLYCSILVAFSNILLNYILIQIWGVKGAALASTLSVSVALFSRYFFARKFINFNLFCSNIAKYTLFSVPFIIFYLLFKKYIDTNNIIMFVFVIFCTLIYIIELKIFKDDFARTIMSKVFYRK